MGNWTSHGKADVLGTAGHVACGTWLLWVSVTIDKLYLWCDLVSPGSYTDLLHHGALQDLASVVLGMEHTRWTPEPKPTYTVTATSYKNLWFYHVNCVCDTDHHVCSLNTYTY